jgi:hypothetical protein
VRFPLRLCCILGGLVFSACDPGQRVDFFQPVTQDPAFPGADGDPAAYDSYFDYTPDPKCAPAVPRKLDRRTEVRIFTGNGVPGSEIYRFVGGLQRYYDYYGVTMFTRHDPIAVPLDHAIVLNEAAIMDWMRKFAGVDPSCASSLYPGTACNQAMGAAMFYNVKQFLRAYAEPDRTVINIVLLKRVASLDPGSDSSTSLMNWGIAGLGLSQDLIGSPNGSDIGSGSLAEVLDETGFSPTVFIAVNLTDFVLKEPDIVIAHEFGHAYSLEHLDPAIYGSNLMNPTASTCDLSLDSSQLDTIEQQTARYGNLLAGSRYDGPELLSFTHRGPEILDIVRARIAATAATALATGAGP